MLFSCDHTQILYNHFPILFMFVGSYFGIQNRVTIICCFGSSKTNLCACESTLFHYIDPWWNVLVMLLANGKLCSRLFNHSNKYILLIYNTDHVKMFPKCKLMINQYFIQASQEILPVTQINQIIHRSLIQLSS